MRNNKNAGAFTICKTLLLILFLSATVCNSFGQNSTNYLQYDQNTAINFNLNSTTTLENTQTITDAFCLHIESASNTAHYYVKASESTSSSTPIPLSDLELLFYSSTSSSYSSLNTSVIPLSSANQLLFEQSQKSTAYNYCYTIEIPAIGYNYPPGTYTFTLTYTMTQP